MTGELPETSGYGRAVIAINAVISIVVTYLILWWVTGINVFHENLFRVQPSVDPLIGVGADWTLGNGEFGWLITVIHFADVVMGLFILLMVFIHWGAFRRLASQMRQPGEEVAADGGSPEQGGESR